MADLISDFDRFRGLLVPHPTVLDQGADAIDETASTLTQAGPRAGTPVKLQDTDLVAVATGDQATGSSLELQTIRSGHPGIDAAGLAWRNVGDAAYRGWDVPNVVDQWEVARQITAGAATTVPEDGIKAITLQDRTVLAVYGTIESSPTATARVQVSIRDLSDPPTWTTATVKNYGYTFSADRNPHPCLVELPSGRVLCFYWHQIQTGADAGDMQVQMSYSDDSGATWSVGSRACLPSDLNYYTMGVGIGTYYSRFHALTAEYFRGDVFLLCSVRTMDYNVPLGMMDGWIQYGSVDLGSTFTETYRTDFDETGEQPERRAGAYPSSVVAGDHIHVVWVSANNSGFGSLPFCYRKLGSAFESLYDADILMLDAGEACTVAATGGTATVIDDGDSLLAASEEGILFAGFRSFETIPSSTEGQCVGLFSLDSGGVWTEWVSRWFNGSVAGVHPSAFGACWQDRRMHVLHHHVDTVGAGTYAPSISCATLGGATTTTRRNLGEHFSMGSQGCRDATWIPIGLPADMGWTNAGAGTLALGTALKITTSASLRTSHRTFTSTTAQGIEAVVDLDVASGGDDTSKVIFARFQLGDGSTEDYIVELWFGATGIALRDVNAGSTIATPTVAATTNGVQVKIELVGSTVRWWTLARTAGSDREWVSQTGTTALTDGGGAVSNEIRWGHANATTAESNWRIVSYGDGGTHGDISEAQANPEDLHPLPWGTVPTYVDSGLLLHASDGPTVTGDAWTQASRYDYEARRLLPWFSPSPREPWRSTVETVQRIVFPFDSGITSVSRAGNVLQAVAVVGANWRLGSIQKDTGGGSFSSITSYDAAAGMASMAYTRTGNTLYPGSGTDKPYLFMNEAREWTVDLGSGKLRRVLGNVEGVWNTTGKQCRIFLDGIDGTEPSSGTMSLWPRDFVVVWRDDTANYAGLRVDIDAQSTVDGYFTAGAMLPGFVAVHGYAYSWGRAVATEANVQLTETAGWTDRARKLSPARRTVEFAWSEGVDTSDLMGSSPSPDYVSSSTTGGAQPVASRFDTPYQVEGLVHLLDGPRVPLVYLPLLIKGPPDAYVINRRSLQVYGRLASPVRLESVQGEEGVSEVVRVASIKIRELV